ncbi:secreted protein C-like [Scyliorhinus canicula]|uniref:secreted protein C-like n=1 Tax=Scyliorhinus canicula TaxID=7830 RepID=UPI0018F3C36F|nr:secreted protein C-like [Scyliorhinus canicula]
MASVLPVLLFCLLLQCTPTYSESPCMIANGTSSSQFNLTVDPSVYMPNTEYNVSISGIQTQVRVALSAVMNGSSIGSWMDNSSMCQGIDENRETSMKYVWTSPGYPANDVKIGAYVKASNETYFLQYSFKSSMTTATPNTSLSTENMSVPATSNASPTSGAMTTSAASNASPISGAMTTSAASNASPTSGAMTTSAASNASPTSGAMTTSAASNASPTSGAMTTSAASNASPTSGRMTTSAASNASPTSGRMTTAATRTANVTNVNEATSTKPIATTTANAMSTFKTSSGFGITLVFFVLIAVQQSLSQ